MTDRLAMNLIIRTVVFFCLAWSVFIPPAFSQEIAPVAWWQFEEQDANFVFDSVGKRLDSVSGNFQIVEGVRGNGIKLDGYTAWIVRNEADSPRLAEGFTIEAWIAIGAYPWNRCPIVDHHKDHDQGYFFGIDDWGHLELSLSAGGWWQRVISEDQIPLRKWTHVGGVYDSRVGATIYINGKIAGHTNIEGAFTPANNLTLLIGKYREKANPTRQVHEGRYFPVEIFWDGIIDELKIFGQSMSVQEIERSYETSRPPEEVPKALPLRQFPSGPPGPGEFGAYYTRLKYDDAWDALWRIGEDADVLVRFDEAGYRYIFWHGASYIPCWVTENGIWYNNEFNETWADGHLGAAEPMGDKQCRHSHVRIIESNDARVVVHWRYASVDILYQFARVDELTGWGDWTDEYHTIYPDGVGVRKIILHSSKPMAPHEWLEAIVVNPPGKRPEDSLETEAVTMANMKGESHTYSWAEAPPQALDKPNHANIEMINIKSKTRPFIIVPPGPCFLRNGRPSDKPSFTPFGGGIRRECSIFPWWNHWPTAMIPSEGRYALAPDRASSSYISTSVEWKDFEITPTSRTRVMLHGLTEKGAGELALLAKSWVQAPTLELECEGYISHGYDESERAYVLTRQDTQKSSALKIHLEANEESPVLNPAFIVKKWGNIYAALKLNGNGIPKGEDFRVGYRKTLDGTDLVAWLKFESLSPLRIELLPCSAFSY
ncbi:MAG: LamG domain-containing protein [bacterium]